LGFVVEEIDTLSKEPK